jgi:hypothetical protein
MKFKFLLSVFLCHFFCIYLESITNQLGQISLARLFSLRHDFPNEWHA